EAGEGPRQDPERQVLGQGERRQGREDALARRRIASKDVPERLLDAEVLTDRKARLRQRAPEWVVARVVIVGQAELRRVVRQVDRARSFAGETQNLRDRVVNIPQRNLVRDEQPARVGWR